MLEIKNITNATIPVIANTDEYIPLKITFGSWDPSIDSTAYWQLKSNQGDFVEIGFAEDSGIIRFITVITLKNTIPLNESFSCDEGFIKGLPVFKTEMIKIEFSGNPCSDKVFLLQERGDISFSLHEKALTTLFNHENISSYVLCNERITLFINKNNNLCGFKVNNLSTHETNTLQMFFKKD